MELFEAAACEVFSFHKSMLTFYYGIFLKLEPGVQKKSMLNDRIMHVFVWSISYRFDHCVVYLDSLRNKPLVICLSELWIYEDFNKEYYKLLDYSPLIFDKRKCPNDGGAKFLHKTISIVQEKINFTLKFVLANCVTQNQETFQIFCFYNAHSDI